MTAIDKVRVALEKARKLHHNDPADHNVGAFLDEALSWIAEVERENQKLWIKVRAMQDAERESVSEPEGYRAGDTRMYMTDSGRIQVTEICVEAGTPGRWKIANKVILLEHDPRLAEKLAW